MLSILYLNLFIVLRAMFRRR